MARCSYHPDVETELTCTECGKPICPKEMVLTPVGYKCPEHARPAKGQYTYVKPAQLAKAAAAALVVGTGGGIVLGMVRFGGLFAGLIWGALTAEAVRRASGGHRVLATALVAAGGIALGWLVGGAWWVAALIAAVTAMVQLAAFGDR